MDYAPPQILDVDVKLETTWSIPEGYITTLEGFRARVIDESGVKSVAVAVYPKNDDTPIVDLSMYMKSGSFYDGVWSVDMYETLKPGDYRYVITAYDARNNVGTYEGTISVPEQSGGSKGEGENWVLKIRGVLIRMALNPLTLFGAALIILDLLLGGRKEK